MNFIASIVGDVNNDGTADILISSSYSSPSDRTSAGIAYVIFGSKNLTNIDFCLQ